MNSAFIHFRNIREIPIRANAKLDNCSTCADCEDLCDALEDILDALHKPDNNTPERLGSSTRIQVPTAAASKTRRSVGKTKRATGSPTPRQRRGKKKCSGGVRSPPNTLPLCRRRNAFDGGEDIFHPMTKKLGRNRNDEGRFSRWRSRSNYR
ncbi:hypothetical protein TNCV_2316601 [Trichonephila clavipes]|nr:hypothetical protein TNCV_2316601 [Trichonephila clavipes]